MASARQDFERFVFWLYHPDRQVSGDVRRLATLALANFNELAGTSRQRSQRSTYLVNIMRRELGDTVEAPPADIAEANAGVWPWARLRNLTLGPFRGSELLSLSTLQSNSYFSTVPMAAGKPAFAKG